MTEKDGLLYGAVVAGIIFVATLGIYSTDITTVVSGADLVLIISIVFGAIAGIMYVLHTVRKTHLFHPRERRFASGLTIVLFLLTIFASRPLLVLLTKVQEFF